MNKAPVRKEDVVVKLNEMKRKIEESQKLADQLSGQLQALYERMVDEFGVESTEQARIKLEQLQATLNEKQAELEAGVAELWEKLQ